MSTQIPLMGTADTPCRICGQMIRYLKYRVYDGQLVERRIPKAHHGACSWEWKLRQAKKVVQKYNKKKLAKA